MKQGKPCRTDVVVCAMMSSQSNYNVNKMTMKSEREARKRRMPGCLAVEIRRIVSEEINPTSRWGRNSESDLAGKCYTATEAYYHATSEAHREKLTPQVVSFDVTNEQGTKYDISHWYLESETGEIIDLTEDQFDCVDRSIPRKDATGKGFVPPSPCSETQQALHKVEDRLTQ